MSATGFRGPYHSGRVTANLSSNYNGDPEKLYVQILRQVKTYFHPLLFELSTYGLPGIDYSEPRLRHIHSDIQSIMHAPEAKRDQLARQMACLWIRSLIDDTTRQLNVGEQANYEVYPYMQARENVCTLIDQISPNGTVEAVPQNKTYPC